MYSNDDLENYNIRFEDYTSTIENMYEYSKTNFSFLPKDYFFGKLDNLINAVNYCFSRKFIDKNDNEFQMYVAKILFNMNDEEVMGLDEYKGTGIYNLNNIEVFTWVCQNILKPETLKTFKDVKRDNTETLFHQLFRSFINIPNDYIDKLFIIFDNAKFDFLTPKTPSLVGYAMRYHNVYLLKELLKRATFDLNSDEIHLTCHLIIRNRIQPLKLHADTYGSFYSYIYKNDDVIRQLFSNFMITSKTDLLKNTVNVSYSSYVNTYINEYFKEHFGDKDYKMILTNSNRAQLVRPSDVLENYLVLFKIIIEKGFDIKKKYNNVTLSQRYLDGSKPIEIHQPALHLKFITLFA